MENEEVLRADRGADQQTDFAKEFQSRDTNWNLRHLTLGDLAIKHFKSDPALRELVPLIDQICSTNNLDDRGIELYRCMLSSKILEMMIWTDEDDETGYGNLDTARMYLFQFLDGTRNGYRGKLATILKREYDVRNIPQKRKKFLGLF